MSDSKFLNGHDPILKQILLCAVLFLLTTPFVLADYSVETREKVYSCGYNSLYLFLCLKRCDISFETVKSNVVIGQNGTSFFDLQTGAAACGIKTQVVRCSYETLRKLPLPVIAWIDRSSTKSRENVLGHFIVLVSCTEKNVTYIDGTSGKRTNVSASTFFNQWNGMVFMEQKSSPILSTHFAILIFVSGLFCVIVMKFLDKKTMISVLICIVSCGYSSQSYATDNTADIWRQPENESVNATYLLLRSNELPCDYKTLAHELSEKTNLQAICDCARTHGLSMQIFHAQNPEILNKIPLPYLIHLSNDDTENEQIWKGNYLLVTGRGNKRFMVVECGTIQIDEVTDETIRRYWSGYVLAKSPKQKTRFWDSSFFISSLIGIAFLFIYFAVRYRGKTVLMFLVSILLLQDAVCADNNIPDPLFSADTVKQTMLKSTEKIKSLRVHYRSEYYTNPDAPKGTYLYRRILAKSPFFLNHTNSHPCNAFSWNNDPLLQQAIILKDIGYNRFPFKNTYFVMKLSPNEGLPGTLPGEFFFNATGIWPIEQRKAPVWDTIPVTLRDVAKNPHYSSVRPQQEQIDGHWCHVLFWENHDYLWLDMERGGVLLARETCHPETGVLMQRYELSNHQEAVPGIWIPQKLRNIQYDYSAKTAEGQKRKVIDGFFDVEEVEVNTLTEADFEFTPPPGALLTYDARDPNARYPYQAVPGGQEMLEYLANWVHSNSMSKKQKTSGFSWGWSVGLLVIPLIVFLEIQRRRKTK